MQTQSINEDNLNLLIVLDDFTMHFDSLIEEEDRIVISYDITIYFFNLDTRRPIFDV